MRSTPPRTDADEGRASPRLAALAAFALAGVAVVAGLAGVYLGQRGGRRALVLGGAACVVAGVGVALLGARARFAKRPRVVGGEGLGSHILALQEALAAAPTNHAARVAAHEGRVECVAVSADGRTALSGGADGCVRLWDLASGFALRELVGVVGPAGAVALSADGRLAAACGRAAQGTDAGVVIAWDVESGREMRRAETGAALSALAFTPDARRLLIGGMDYLHVLDLESDELLAMIRVSLVPGTATVIALAASPDGKRALCGCDRSPEARLIDLGSGETVRRFAGHRAWFRAAVSGVAFSPDGTRALTCGLDRKVRVHDVESGEQPSSFAGHRGAVVGVSFLPGGTNAISAGADGSVRTWSVKKGEQQGRHDHGARVTCVAVSADGQVAVSGGSDGALRTWRLGS